MKPIGELSADEAGRIDLLFCDIDDTVTTEGRLSAEAYSAIWDLANAGFSVVPVTGRPAGWCDHFARMWPVAGVIGENGAFYFRYAEGRLQQRFILSAEERAALSKRFGDLAERILAEVPGCAIASDQGYRIHDLAIDFAEDVPHLDDAAIDRIVALFEEVGATAKVSSIHVNGWFGSYDKLSMIKLFATEVLGVDLEADQSRAIYIGDSPNDEPAFGFFNASVGVQNVVAFAERLQHPPRFVTAGHSGAGFAELVAHLLRAR